MAVHNSVQTQGQLKHNSCCISNCQAICFVPMNGSSSSGFVQKHFSRYTVHILLHTRIMRYHNSTAFYTQ